ncbi:MAG TPA: alpha/beta fold hydrolase [Gaiella sp.]|nr:alpha/beta fold hydrolase [Gaiella sp.]
MKPPPTRSLTPARIVALVLIGVAVAALATLGFSRDDRVSVPRGAQAGDLVLEPCTYATDDGRLDADCGTLVVSENASDPHARLIALPVTRIRARSAHPHTPLFRLEGGPGITNMRFPSAGRFAADRDVVLVGYRGVDGSVRLDCPEVDSALGHSTDLLGQTSFRAYAKGFRDCAARLSGDGYDLTRYGLSQQVDDMEAARKALGYERVDLLSESAGTRTALIYAWRHPHRIHRSVMVGVNPPGHFVWDRKTTDEQVARYAALCEKDESCSSRTDDLAASSRRTATTMPDRWLFLPIQASAVRIFSFYGLMETTSELAPLNAPTAIDSWLAVSEGDASGLWLQSLAAKLAPMPFVWGQYASAARLDAGAAKEYFASGTERGGTGLGYAATAFAWGGGRLADAWPSAPDENAYSRMRESRVPTLLVGGALDVSTPPQNARKELLPYLPNGRQVVLPGFGHSGSFWHDQPQAGTHLVATFLDSGRVDDSRYRPQKVDFTPTVTLPTLAKGIAAGLVVLPLIVVVLLVGMARRLHHRGSFGPVSSAALRTVVPVVLGLGGWLLGVLLAITVMPGVPLDDELLASLSAGAPIGLGIYLAWVHRDWSGRSRGIGFAAALAGALTGAWLGFQAAADLVALLTTIAGATVGANLALLLLDVAWDRQRHDRAVPSRAAAIEARPSVG